MSLLLLWLFHVFALVLVLSVTCGVDGFWLLLLWVGLGRVLMPLVDCCAVVWWLFVSISLFVACGACGILGLWWLIVLLLHGVGSPGVVTCGYCLTSDCLLMVWCIIGFGLVGCW